jgi:hypothetical protein
MDFVVHAVGWCIEALLRPLDALAPWASLAIAGVLTGVIALVVIRKTSPQRRIRHARAQAAAALFEMRLYLDHPLQLLRAQGRLVLWSFVNVAYLLPSMLALAVPFGLLFVHLEIRHGIAPLAPHATVVMRIEVAPQVSPRAVTLDTRGAVAVTARVHAEDEHALYARLAVRGAGTHAVKVRAANAEVVTPIVADATADVISRERRHGIAQLWAFGAEPAIDGDTIRSISLPYPDRPSPFAVPWWLYWLGVATVAAMALRQRFGVAI